MLMAGPLSSNPLTNPLLCARSFKRTLLSQVPAILLLDTTKLLIFETNKQNVKMSKSRRLSGLGKGAWY